MGERVVVSCWDMQEKREEPGDEAEDGEEEG